VFGTTTVKGLVPGPIANELATWETSTKTDIAVDMNLFYNLNFSLDFFKEIRSNILAQRSAEIPGSLGATLPLENIGKVKNQGIESSISYNQTIRDFQFSFGGNFTYAKNEILEMAEAAGTSDLLRRTGRPIYAYYGFKTDGIFQNEAEINSYAKQEVAGTQYVTKPGDIKYVDVNGDGVSDANDRTYLGYGNVPNIIYGITGKVNYRGFDLSFLFQGADQVVLQLTGGVIMPYYNDGNLPKVLVDGCWTEENRSNRYPRLAQSIHNYPTNDVPVETYMYDASYIRLKNIEFGYSLPQKWLTATHLRNVRFYISGQNMLTFSGLDLVDPEINNNAGWQYPVMKAFNFGISINL